MKVMVEVEVRVYEVKLIEDYNRRMFIERMNGEREKWFVVINIIFSYIEGK